MEESEKVKSLRVLLAEDNKVNQKLMLLMLGKLGAQTEVASNGVEAVEKATAAPHELILMDLHMPGMDGLQATREIIEKQGASAAPIVALTADAMGATVEEALRTGMEGFLTKPVSADQLKACLQKHTGINL